jgi:hypothetical protein
VGICLFVGDAAFGDPGVYGYCEGERVTYLIRLPAGKVAKVCNGRGDVENLIKEGKNARG